MGTKIQKVLANKEDNYIFPFFWLKGEDEATIRRYMQAIDEANMKAVCIESRPHPDFCKELWWRDLDIILDEAKKRKMKVWILDDSHFPTGYANGAMKDQPDELCRQSIALKRVEVKKGETLCLAEDELMHPTPFVPTEIEDFIGEKQPRVFSDDRLISCIGIRNKDRSGLTIEQVINKDKVIDLMPKVRNKSLTFTAEDEDYTLYFVHTSRNLGFNRSYINMLSKASCKVLIDAVYEPHYARYKELFHTTIVGFFSDEPEFGNGHKFEQDIAMGSAVDHPFSVEVMEKLTDRYDMFSNDLFLFLWENEADASSKARFRYDFMDVVTRQVKEAFSYQLGDWCRERGVEYIGHLIEDNNMHTKTGNSLGHYFRGLAGQSMSGIDNIGGQVLPQGEELDYDKGIFERRIGEFYHYGLGKLASSAASIEPLKNGNSMCEIFGAYGWQEGVVLEKYLVDHFLVRGINHYVPHAFSAACYPDLDCPPHFYAHGNHPQYRHFKELMKYTNKMCELISGGVHQVEVAVLYHGEGEWAGESMFFQKVGHPLYDAQIDYDVIPFDVFTNRSEYQTLIQQHQLRVHQQMYKAVIVPYMEFIPMEFAKAVGQMVESQIPVFFIQDLPKGISNLDGKHKEEELLANLQFAKVVQLEKLVDRLEKEGIYEIHFVPSNQRIRVYHYEYFDKNGILLLVNEGTKSYEGRVEFKDSRYGYFYDCWNNQIENSDFDGQTFHLVLEPGHTKILVLDQLKPDDASYHLSLRDKIKDIQKEKGRGQEVTTAIRSICRSIDYPNFVQHKQITFPDQLAIEEEAFSGFVRYEIELEEQAFEKEQYLIIEQAAEGVEVFIDQKSLGIQIVPPFCYALTPYLEKANNSIRIEVATTLERENAKIPDLFGQIKVATSESGITGKVYLLR